MAEYVCPKHDDVILFTDDEEKDLHRSMANEVRIEPPKQCEKCNVYYYRSECRKK